MRNSSTAGGVVRAQTGMTESGRTQRNSTGPHRAGCTCGGRTGVYPPELDWVTILREGGSPWSRRKVEVP